ncbi:unnamed protein product [Rotaria sordida]|uniref:Protein kinase domain-containing protein n=1 Tax=Rotaria sordida TaxID=392033 RepID=A0A819MEP2_9BILA|nr:unnamed protein product [Rotaria sordida]
MKLLTDGELFYRIRTQTSFSEKEARQLMKKFILTVNFMHNNDLCHRDFKPEVRAVNVTMRAFQKADQFQLSSVTNGVLTRRRYNKKSTDSCLFTSSLKITRPAQQKFGQQDSKSECDSYECFRSKTANGFLRSSSLKQLSGVFDIEQFTEYCPTTYAVCPCYTSRLLINDVQIILYSYHYFIDPRVRNSILIFASGTLAPLATYFGEFTISFDTQMNLLLEYNHVIDIQPTHQNIDRLDFQDECDLVLLDVCQHMPYDVLYLLNVTLTTVEQLNYAQRYRILMCFKATDQRKMK